MEVPTLKLPKLIIMYIDILVHFWYNIGTVNNYSTGDTKMLSDKELNWMSENAAEIAAKRAEVAAEIKLYVRASDGATAKAQDGKCIEISLPAPDRNDPWWDELPRIGCRVKILRENGFVWVQE